MAEAGAFLGQAREEALLDPGRAVSLTARTAADVDAVTQLDHHPAGIFRHEVDPTGTFTQVATEDAAAEQAKEDR